MRPDGRSSAAPVSSTAPKKKSFDRGGPVWPPRSNVANDRLGGGLGGLCPPSQNSGGLGGSAPQPKSKKKKNFFFIFRKVGLEKSVPADGEICFASFLRCRLPQSMPRLSGRTADGQDIAVMYSKIVQSIIS